MILVETAANVPWMLSKILGTDLQLGIYGQTFRP